MLYLKSFTFNPFQENTYIIYTDQKNAFIIDPGNSTITENSQVCDFLLENKLQLKRLLLTHAHLDHVLGNHFIYEKFGLLPEVNKEDLFFIERMKESAAMYGIRCELSPKPANFINEGDEITLDNYTFQCIHTPGHSPGSISYYNKENNILISGDVLFNGSIGRSDLPLGDHDTLIRSITEKLMLLPDETKVYSGHGPSTTIGRERTSNPFLT